MMRDAATSSPPRGAYPAAPGLSEQEFALLQALIREEAGIFLHPSKRELVLARLGRRLRELGLQSFRQYYKQIVGGDEAERIRMLDCICTNETHFFREPAHFEFLRRCVEEWTARASRGEMAPRVRVWSAACSTGEEPYSLAIALRKSFSDKSGWGVEILATDLSTRALDLAGAAVFPIAKAAEIPLDDLKAFMLKGRGSQEGKMKVSAGIRSMVQFRRLNLNDQAYPVTGLFDMIFCRNVLIYFDAITKAAVIRRLVRHLAPHGYLFLGHSESVLGMADLVRSVGPTVYAHARGGLAMARAGDARSRP